MSAAKVTILVPNYKTPELTKLCLRLIRKHTDPKLADVIVIDNDSQDASTEYLRSLQWIQLIERPAVAGEQGYEAHARALDLALAQVRTPYVLSIHTDTLIRRSDWLVYLLNQIEPYPKRAGVGSWKLEVKPWYKRLLKGLEHSTGNHAFRYLRSHCALYRMSVINALNVGFFEKEATSGKYMHQAMEQAGYEMMFLPEAQLLQYIDHINHATVVLNPELSSRTKSVKKGMKRVKRQLAAFNAEQILQNTALDH